MRGLHPFLEQTAQSLKSLTRYRFASPMKKRTTGLVAGASGGRQDAPAENNVPEVRFNGFSDLFET